MATLFESILGALRSREESTRQRGLLTFEDYVRSSLANTKPEEADSFWNDVINKILFPLTARSDTPQEKLIGIQAIDKLLLSPSDDAHPTTVSTLPPNQVQIPSINYNPEVYDNAPASSAPSMSRYLYRLLRYLKNLLPDSDLTVMFKAAETYGRILAVGGQTFADNIGEMEVQMAVALMTETGEAEWTGSNQRQLMIQQQQAKLATVDGSAQISATKILAPYARIAGELMLIQLARHSPLLYYSHISLILGRILVPLRDPTRIWVMSPLDINSAELGWSSASSPAFSSSYYFASSTSNLSLFGVTNSPSSSNTSESPTASTSAPKRKEAVAVVRRLAARLFSVSLDVIESQEATGVPNIPDTAAILAQAKQLNRSSYLSSRLSHQHLASQTYSLTSSSTINGPPPYSGPPINEALNLVATAACTDLNAADVHRQFAALLIFRELFLSPFAAAVAGITAGGIGQIIVGQEYGPEGYRSEGSGRGGLIRGGVRYSERDPHARMSMVHTDGGTSGTLSMQHSVPTRGGHSQGGKPGTHSKGSAVPEIQKESGLDPYPFIFATIFKLATRVTSQPTTATSLLGLGNSTSLAQLLTPTSPLNPSSPQGWGASTPYTPSPIAPALSKDQAQERLRKEALSLLPVCATYDTEKFRHDGWFRETMRVLLLGWGFDLSPGSLRITGGTELDFGQSDGYERHPELAEKARDILSKVPPEKGDRSYLLRTLGQLTHAMISTETGGSAMVGAGSNGKNAILSYIREIGMVVNQALDSRSPPGAGFGDFGVGVGVPIIKSPWAYQSYYGKKLAAFEARHQDAPKARNKIRGKSGFDPNNPGVVKGSISDEILFETIELLAHSLRSHLVKATQGNNQPSFKSLSGITEKSTKEFGMDEQPTMVDKMFRYGLSPTLCSCLGPMVKDLPELLGEVQEHLLNEISTILTGHGYHPPGAPDLEEYNVGKPETEPALVRLALTTLQTFDWRERTLTPLIREGVLRYMDSSNRDVRLQASLAACTLFMADPISHHTSVESVNTINQVLNKLITVGIADADADVRAAVLGSLDPRYDRHLAQVEHIRALAMALNDEEPNVRMQAVVIMGRLANLNPANVMPSLRLELIKLLTELEYSTDAKNMLTTAEVLTQLLKSTERLIKPYAPSLLRVCLPKARDPTPYVSRRMIECIGLLAEIAGEDIIPALDEIMDLLISTLQDPIASPAKKDVALVSLGQVCGNTANVIDPYNKYPELWVIFRKFLKGESTAKTKRLVLKVMGILGAIDPYAIKAPPESEGKDGSGSSRVLQQSVKNVGAQPEVFYQSVVIQSLLGILADPALASNHPAVIDVLLSIFKTQGLKCVPFLPQIIPAFSAMCRSSSTRHQDHFLQQNYLQQMSLIVQIVGPHIRNYLQEVFELTTELWSNRSLHLPIVGLIESLATAMAAEFKRFLPTVIPQLLTVFDEPPSQERSQTEIKVFHTMLAFGSAVEQYIHLLLPVLSATIEREGANRETRRAAIKTIAGLARRVNLSTAASRIIQPLVRNLPAADTQLREDTMNTLCVLAQQLGPDFAIFVPRISNCLTSCGISWPKYDNYVERLLKGDALPQENGADDSWSKTGYTDPVAAADLTRLTVNQPQLKSSWSLSHIVRPEDWKRWFKRLCLELLKESTSHALRACVSLASTYQPLSRQLFNAAFYSCWVELNDPNKDDLVRTISFALDESGDSDLRLALLSVVEFMEHEDKALPIDNRTLGDIAANTNALAKALHYKEHEFISNPSAAVVEHLIGINTQLKQKDAALGLLMNDSLNQDIEPVLWYEQLERWEPALEKYQERLQDDPTSMELIMGRLRCLHALSEWDALSKVMETQWPASSTEERGGLAPMAAAAAWVLRKWPQMEVYTSAMGHESPDRSFYKAILSVHNHQYESAAAHIARARDSLHENMGPIDDHNRIYSTMVRVQLLSELEEIITYKKIADQPERRQMLQKTWVKRLYGCQHDVDTWQKILQLRSLVLSPSEDSSSYIKFANLCRKEKRFALSELVIQQLLNDQAKRDTPIRASPGVVFAHLKLLWDNNEKHESLGFLSNVCISLAHDLGLDDPRRTITGSKEEIDGIRKLLSRAYLKQGQWRQELQTEWNPDLIDEVVYCYHQAAKLAPQSYKAWHTWALCNFEIINYLENSDDDRDEETQAEALRTRILAAVEGFFHSVALGGENPIQDSLRILTLWFKFGSDKEVSQTVAEHLNTISIDTWLEVVPQLIARIQTPSPIIRHQVNALLTEVGRVHPQALIYPLTVASKSTSELRKTTASEIMNRLRDHSSVLVEQALLVSHELIRVAILWHELWHEYLEEASRLYFTEKKPEAMVEHLEVLHRRLDEGPETTREANFVQVHGRDLREAREACHRYMHTHDVAEMDKAWDIYYAVFRRIEKQLPHLNTIELQYVSPKLLQAENLELAVPGTYRSGKPIVRIARFVPKLSVIASKQRPRRLAINGSDGKEYQYCLKGHEDLRQDERVMQVFSLVNTLLAADRQSFMRKLHIQGFAVTPLAPNVGLLRWVQHADTLHVLVSDYRAARKIHLQIEYRLMLQMAPDYVNLTMLQKLEVFKYALDNTTGQDLYRVLWLTSADSEAWLERRSTYTRSLAVSSMVGHILGLGDRHPANLLLDQVTGKVVHIDFGDCFEVAMHREKFPERIPFRLTRMLVNAMEVCEIKGSFKVTSEITMKVLRNNKEPLMAVLEAFIYDPLISWRLTETDSRSRMDGADHPATTSNHNSRFAGAPRRKLQLKEELALDEDMTEVRNERALAVYKRVQSKLLGRDFNPDEELTVEEQVQKLILEATKLENLCQCFPGWCPFW